MAREKITHQPDPHRQASSPTEDTILNTSYTTSQRTILQMQQQHGNRAVLRMINQMPRRAANRVQRSPQINTEHPPTKVPEKREVYAAGLFLPTEYDAKLTDWYNGNDAAFDGSFAKVFPTYVNASLLGVGMDAPVHPKLADALKSANDKLKALNIDNSVLAKRGFKIGGIGSNTESRGGSSYHALGLAIDIDSGKNPYVMHEDKEANLDKHLAPIYNRISLFMLGKSDSVITRADGMVKNAKMADPARAAQMYDELFSESQGMKLYFQLMNDSAKLKQFLTQDATQPGAISAGQLGGYTTSEKSTDEQGDSTVTETRHGVTTLSKPMAELVKGAFNFDLDPAKIDEAVKKIQVQMAEDWSWLTNAKADLSNSSITDADVTNKAPGKIMKDDKSKEADKPFKSTTPLGGFMNIDADVVQALVSSGLAWGACDFGGASGDIMHFDLRTKFSRGKFDADHKQMAAALKAAQKPNP